MKTALAYVEPEPPPEEYTEEQTEGIYSSSVGLGLYKKVGQKLTIPNRKVTKLGFWLKKSGSPTGDVTYQIRKVSDDSLITEKVLCDAAEIPIERTYEEAVLDTPTLINEEVRIIVIHPNAQASHRISFYYAEADLKANECFTRYSNTTWTDDTANEMTYRYKYYEV
ncbi:hypothetical protein ES708_32763 [subsurface metagenome]